MTNSDLERLSARFERFAEEARIYDCPLYENLSMWIAQDETILAIAQQVSRPPEPNVLFAVVHYLLARNGDHDLSRYYGSLAEPSLPAKDAYPPFREFLLSRRSEAILLLRTRITQTNEVRRCSYLLPAFFEVCESTDNLPLALIDVGCSAGLHLNWDRYFYDYGDVQVGNPAASVAIQCEFRGPGRPLLRRRFPACAYRLGIDLNPVDLADLEERRWFEALIWPDHAERRSIAVAAINEALAFPPPMIRGDAVSVLAGQLRDVPSNTALTVYHCHALCQASREEVNMFHGVLLEYSSQRLIHVLSCEGSEVWLKTMRNGRLMERQLAKKDGHGRWLEWL